jgi:putative ABC transport system permease protein
VHDVRVTWLGLVRKNLFRRPARTLLTAAGVSLGVALIVALLSITQGVHRTAGDLIHIGRADFGVFQSDVSDLTRSYLPQELAASIRSVPGVDQTAQVKLYVAPQGLVFGFDPNEFAMRRFVVVAGRRPRTANEAVVGDGSKRRLGSVVAVGTRRFPVVGVFHSGDRFVDNGVVLPLRTVQALARRPREVTTIGITVKLGWRPREVASAIERRFGGVTAVTEPGQAVKVDTSSRLIVSTGWIVSLLALIVGGIGVTNTMAMSVFERTREIGVLRAVGWRTRRIASLIVSEAIGICLLAAAIGLALGVAASEVFVRHSALSSLVRPHYGASVWAWGLAFALGVGLIGAVYPTLRAVRLTPIEALRHE